MLIHLMYYGNLFGLFYLQVFSYGALSGTVGVGGVSGGAVCSVSGGVSPPGGLGLYAPRAPPRAPPRYEYVHLMSYAWLFYS